MIQGMQLITKNEPCKKTVTHIEKRKGAQVNLMQVICNLLDWGELYYCQFKYNAGLEYLRMQTANDPVSLAYLEQSKTFWAWWKNCWLLRDEVFAADMGIIENIVFRRNIYQQINKPEHLMFDLEASYAMMIEFINKEMAQHGQYCSL